VIYLFIYFSIYLFILNVFVIFIYKYVCYYFAENTQKAQLTVVPQVLQIQEGNLLTMTCTQTVGPINEMDPRKFYKVTC
jgi:hypothetical protein